MPFSAPWPVFALLLIIVIAASLATGISLGRFTVTILNRRN